MDRQYQKIGVYLSSKSGLPAAYEQAARQRKEPKAAHEGTDSQDEA